MQRLKRLLPILTSSSTIKMIEFRFCSQLADICIAAGTYTYPFECPLASEFPSTTFIPQGEVKYYANLVLDRPSWPIRTSEFPFTVIKPLDLSTDFSVQVRDFTFCLLPSLAEAVTDVLSTRRNRSKKQSTRAFIFAVYYAAGNQRC